MPTSELSFRRLDLKRIVTLPAIMLMLALLYGCAQSTPVSVGATTPALSPAASAMPTGRHSAAPQASPAGTQAEASAAPTAAASRPKAYHWPLDASGLFSPGGVPDDFAAPLHVSDGGLKFLYLTEEGNIRKAVWNGAGYTTAPLAENLIAGNTLSIVVDEADSLLFCPGVRQPAGGKSAPCVVMVDMSDGTRCNLDEAAKFREEGRALTAEMQYRSGRLLVRLAGADGKALDQWAVFDVKKRTYAVLDLSGFMEKHMAGWAEPVSLTVALTGENAALAVCTAGGYAAPEATAEGGAAKSLYECLAFPIDLAGSPTGEAVKVAGGERKDCCKLQNGSHFRASPDASRLLYAGAAGGLYVYDSARNIESPVCESGTAVAFAAWGKDGAAYYAAEAQPAGGCLIYRYAATPQPQN